MDLELKIECQSYLLDNIDEAIIIANHDKNDIIYANEKAKALIQDWTPLSEEEFDLN